MHLISKVSLRIILDLLIECNDRYTWDSNSIYLSLSEFDYKFAVLKQRKWIISRYNRTDYRREIFDFFFRHERSLTDRSFILVEFFIRIGNIRGCKNWMSSWIIEPLFVFNRRSSILAIRLDQNYLMFRSDIIADPNERQLYGELNAFTYRSNLTFILYDQSGSLVLRQDLSSISWIEILLEVH